VLKSTNVSNDGKNHQPILKQELRTYFYTCEISFAILYWSAKIASMEQRKPPESGGLLFVINAKYRWSIRLRYLGEI
jgi:hypothetical protein